MVAAGIDLQRHYGFKSCSPSRCSFQSGRLPVHVLDANTVPESFNPNDTVSGYAGIPRNMTTIATFLKRGGYKTASGRKSPLTTKNLLEDTDGLRRPP